MPKTLYVEFEDGNYLDIELVDNNPILEMWIDVHNKNQLSTNKNYLSRRGMYLYHGWGKEYKDKQEETRNWAVDEINKAIDEWDALLPEHPFPHRAFYGMDWKQTNLIHRAFTTSMRSKGTFDMGMTREELLDLKYHDNYIEVLRDPKYRVFPPTTDWNKFITFDEHEIYTLLERINKYVHVHEDNSWSEVASNASPQEAIDCCYLETEWDTYNPDGSKTYHFERIPRQHRTYCNYDPEGIDVYICKNITGKDYIQAYQENDDPLQWDIVNMDHINGGFTVDPNRFLYKWLYADNTKKWLEDHQMPFDLELLQPPALGRVRNKDWFTKSWPSVDYDQSRKNTQGDFMLTPQGTVVNSELH